MKPLIYIYGTPEFMEKQTYIPYRDALIAAGAEVLHTSDPADAAGCIGLLLPGGGDVASFHYGQEDCGSNPPDPVRDAAELKLAREFLEKKLPIMGVCRGAQVLNIVLGGTLIQDMSGHKPDVVDGWVLHPVDAEPGSRMAQLLGEHPVVNSYHHQAVDIVGRDLRVTMRAADGTVEALEHETLPVFATHWHPEKMTGQWASPDRVESGALFAYFVQLCREAAEVRNG